MSFKWGCALSIFVSALTITGGATASSSQAPSITSFSPTRGLVGQKVTIYGAGLGGVQSVQFNGVAASSEASNAAGTQITVVVPPEVTTVPGTITVTTPSGTVTSASSFVVEPTGGTSSTAPRGVVSGSRPLIRSIAPISVKPGARVTITGVNFRGARLVKVSGIKAAFTVPSTTQIVATVPEAARSGMIAVTTKFGTATVHLSIIG